MALLVPIKHYQVAEKLGLDIYAATSLRVIQNPAEVDPN